MKYILLFIINASLLSCTSNAQPSNKTVDATAFEKDMTAGNAQLLDVRTTGEYQGGHIKNAMLAEWTNPEQFKERVQYLDKSQPVLVYCASGVRSGQAAQWLADNGFVNVENLKGGFNQWKTENKPAENVIATPQLSAQEYNQFLHASNTVLISFRTDWCPPCRKMDPVIKAVEADQQGNFKLVQIDGGINTNLVQEQHITTLPTFIIYKSGKETWRKEGIVEKDELLTQLK